MSDRDSHIAPPFRVAGTIGCLTLARRAMGGCCSRLYDRLPYGFNTMEDISKWLLGHNSYSVYSFDIFDTLLRRRIDPPETIKWLVAQHMSSCLATHGVQVSPQDILMQRNKTEAKLRQDAKSTGGDPQCCLDDIISGTLRSFGAADFCDFREIVNYELLLEKKATQPMPGVTDVLIHLRSSQKRIVGTSETYLSLAQITSILEHHHLLPFVDRLYVSSDIGRGKPTGGLFRSILDNEGKNIVHIGDNYVLDNRIPRSLGIKTLWFHSRGERQRKTRLRRLLRSENKMGYVNAVVGSAHQADSTLYNIGYEVLGPVLTVFVHNVAELARKQGIHRLFFVARDGFAMKKIYEILRSTVCTGPGFPAGSYMCLGRLPVRLASLDRLTPAHISDVYPYLARFRGDNVNLGDILKSHGLETTHLVDIARRHGVEIDEPVGYPIREAKLLALLESEDFQETIRTQTNAVRQLLQQYLRGIGFMGKGKVAVVDANAEGITQSLLDGIFMADKDYPVVMRYYLNAVNLNPNRAGINPDLPQVMGILSDWRKDSEAEQRLLFIFGMLIELFAHPNHGVTIGYRNVNGRVRPVFKATPQDSQYQMTSQALKGMLSYAKDYGMGYSLHNYSCEELLVDAKRNILMWMASPPRCHAAGLVNLFTTSDWPLESNRSLINRIGPWDLLTIRGLIRKQNSCLWVEGTRASAPVPGLNSLYHMAAVRRNQFRRFVPPRRAIQR